MTRVLLTGARAPATLDLARALWRAGHHVELAESIGWHLSRGSRAVRHEHRLPWAAGDSTRYINKLDQLLKARRIDVYIPTCEEIFYVAAAHERLSATCRVLSAPLPQLARLHDKARFVETTRRCGLLAPNSVRVHNRADLEAALRHAWRDARPVVLKPVFSRFAARVVIAPRGLSDIEPILPTDRDPWLVQDLVTGRHLCTFGLAKRGRLLAHAAYPTRYTLGVGTSVHFVADHDPTILAWVERFVAAENFSGQIGFDLIQDAKGQLWAIECNPRLTSGVHLLTHQPGLIDAYLGASPASKNANEPADSGANDETRVRDDLVDARGSRPAMLGVSMWLCLPQTARTWIALSAWWKDWRQARDVAVDWRDPVPMLWSRFVWLAGLVVRGRRLRLSGQQAATVDMEWNGAESVGPRTKHHGD